MKKYTKYLALFCVMAMGGAYTASVEASFMDSVSSGLSSMKHKAMNAMDECNAGAGGSGKGLQVAEKCIGEPGKNPNFAIAYWKAHCNCGNPGGDGDETLCANAFAAVKAPDGFTGCNEASDEAIDGIEDPKDKAKGVAFIAKTCIDDSKQLKKAAEGDNQDADELALVTAFHTAHCSAEDADGNPNPDAKKYKKTCAAIVKMVPSLAAAG